MRRSCSRATCSQPAVATLTFVYADSMAVLGPLALDVEPGSYDLCAMHAASTSAPKGWEILRLIDDAPQLPEPDADDLETLAAAVRAAGFADYPDAAPGIERAEPLPATIVELGRRGHLSLIADAGQDRP